MVYVYVTQLDDMRNVFRITLMTGEQHISLVDLNNCCDFDDLLINAYVKKSYA